MWSGYSDIIRINYREDDQRIHDAAIGDITGDKCIGMMVAYGSRASNPPTRNGISDCGIGLFQLACVIISPSNMSIILMWPMGKKRAIRSKQKVTEEDSSYE